MVRVCTDTLINEKRPERNGFYMDDVLKENLDALIKNVKNDWDFCILISGGGRVRVGKSLLALQIAYYWTDQIKKVHNIDVPFTLEKNVVFRGTELIEKGNYLGQNFPYSSLVFDEAGADLSSSKVLRRTTQDVKDFLRECGQYNLLTILVVPEFFDLPKGIALSRSDCLIDVFTMADEKGIFQRGFFNFYSRPNKKFLYLYGKKELNYKAHGYDFHGRYYNNYPVNEEKYRELKMFALKDREKDTAQEKYLAQRNILFKILIEKFGLSHSKLSELLKDYGITISKEGITKSLSSQTKENTNRIVLQTDDDVDEVEGGLEE